MSRRHKATFTRRKAPKKKKKRTPEPVAKLCIMCNKKHVRDSVYCSSACRARAGRNESYFAGRMQEAVGWDTKECQACLVLVKKPRKFHIHHVFSHPSTGGTHDNLVVLCAGCHMIVSKLAWRKIGIPELERIVAFVLMQKAKGGPQLEVDIEVQAK